MERSDHAPFTDLGLPASHLMARGESGVDWAYHRPWDTLDRLQEDTLGQAVVAVLGVARGPRLPADRHGTPAFVVPGLGWVVPGWLTWLLIGASLGLALLGVAERPGKRALDNGMRVVALWSTATLVGGLGLVLVTGGRRMDLALAGPALLAGWAGWWAVWVVFPYVPTSVSARQLAVLLPCGATALFLFAGAPLLALPFAVSAAGVGLSRWSRPLGVGLAAWPAAYLCRADTVRELDFHHLFYASPTLWSIVVGLVMLPILGGLGDWRPPHAQRFAGVLGLALVGALLWGWTTPEQLAPFVDR